MWMSEEPAKGMKVAIHLRDNLIEGATLIFWEDPEMIQDCLGDGDILVDVEEVLKGESERIFNLSEMLHSLQEADNLSCGDSSILSDVIPNLIIQALNNKGYLKKVRRRSHVK